MNLFSSLRSIVSGIPRNEKILLCVLALVAAVALGQFAFSNPFMAGKEEGVFTEGMVGHFKNINPIFADLNDADRDLASLVFSGLVRYDPVQKNLVPDLAERWERSSNGLVYTLTLRADALFHDGTPVTVDDVIFTYAAVIQHPSFRNPVLRENFASVKIEKNAERKIQFTLARPNSYFLSELMVGILPKHLLEQTPVASLEKSSFGQHPVGSGPFALTAFQTSADGDYADLTAFDRYYGPPPAVKKIRFFAFPNEESLMKVHRALTAISKIHAESANAQELTAEGNWQSVPYTLNQFSAIFINTEHAFLANPKIRKALALGLPKERLLSKGARRVDAIDLGSRPDHPQFAYNPDAAQKMLTEAGLTKGNDGLLLDSKGKKVSFLLLAHAGIPAILLEKIRAEWRKLGVDIILEQAEGVDFATLLNDRRYDLLLMRQNLGYNLDVYSLFHSSQKGGLDELNPGQNFSQFKTFQTDGLTEALRKEKDPQDKKKLLAQLSSVIAEETPVIFLETPVYEYAVAKTHPLEFGQGTLSLHFHSDRASLLIRNEASQQGTSTPPIL